mgnify:CR=1 FL=1
MKRSLLHLAWLLTVAVAAQAQGPNGTENYYSRANGKHGEELKTAFYEIIKGPSVLTYDDLWRAYAISDVHEVEGQMLLWDIYSNITAYTTESPHKNSYEGSGLNREHSFPKSWFGGVKPAVSDLVHVIPTDGYINNMRSDLPYGETDSPFKGSKMEAGVDGPPYYSQVGKCSIEGYAKNIFEPADEWKGDLARIYFYMATCYESEMLSWINLGKTDMLGGNSYQPFASWCFPMLLRWSAEDPVSEKEQLRNESIWLLQGNRNPFVDYPGLEDYLWGDLSEVDFSYEGSGVPPELEPVVATTCDISLNKSTFGVDWGNRNTREYMERYPVTLEQNGVTVTYNYGIEGQNMYANDSQIRLYKYNTLTFRTDANEMTSITFTVVKNDSGKEFIPSTGTMEGNTWTGNAHEVQFTVTEGNGNVQISKAHVEVGDATDIELVQRDPQNGQEAIYGIDGRQYDTLQPGLNIIRMKNGTVKKVWVRQ